MTIAEKKIGSRRQGDLQHEALTMALALLAERIRGLSKEDRDDLLALAGELPEASEGEEVDSLVTAMREILEQRPITAREMDLPADDPPPGPALRRWIDQVSERLRTLRSEAGLTQAEMAERSGLPQSHISRLENGRHSPSRATLEKIAAALGRPVSDFDPSA
jgi:DNA-binding XRE family transcriptional regulator